MVRLAELQVAIAHERGARGFTTDPVRLLNLLTEELGEVAREVKKTWSTNYEALDVDRLAPELADVFVLICALAQEFGVDLEDAVQAKFFEADADRSWPSAVTARAATDTPDRKRPPLD